MLFSNRVVFPRSFSSKSTSDWERESERRVSHPSALVREVFFTDAAKGYFKIKEEHIQKGIKDKNKKIRWLAFSLLKAPDGFVIDQLMDEFRCSKDLTSASVAWDGNKIQIKGHQSQSLYGRDEPYLITVEMILILLFGNWVCSEDADWSLTHLKTVASWNKGYLNTLMLLRKEVFEVLSIEEIENRLGSASLLSTMFDVSPSKVEKRVQEVKNKLIALKESQQLKSFVGLASENKVRSKAL